MPGRPQTPLKSGLPFGRRGAGAVMSTFALSDWAEAGGPDSEKPDTRATINHSGVLMADSLSREPEVRGAL